MSSQEKLPGHIDNYYCTSFTIVFTYKDKQCLILINSCRWLFQLMKHFYQSARVVRWSQFTTLMIRVRILQPVRKIKSKIAKLFKLKKLLIHQNVKVTQNFDSLIFDEDSFNAQKHFKNSLFPTICLGDQTAERERERLCAGK